MTLSPALTQALARGRPGFNARVAAQRKAQAGFDTAALAAVIEAQLDPIAVAVAEVAAERVDAAVAAAFDMAVALVAQRLVGPGGRRPCVDRLWREVAPTYAAPLAAQPAATLGSLTNAALRIAATTGADVDAWLGLMRALAPHATAETLRAIGQIAAWRAGMAHYRAGALAAADALPAEVALAAVGGAGEWAAVRAAFGANRWWSPDGSGAGGIVFGDFAGFGGLFHEPPAIAAAADGFLVRSGGGHGLIVADCFGATFHPATADEYAAAERDAAARLRPAGSSVRAGDRTIATDLPGEGLSAIANADSVAIASPFSHAIAIHPWRLP